MGGSMKNTKSLKNNKGFTLIELLVVLALIAISVGVAGIAMSNSAQNNLRKCATEANSVLARCRINAMYRPSPTVQFRISGGNIEARYFEEFEDGGEPIDTRILGRNNVDVTLVAGSNVIPISETFRIGFDRRGALLMFDNNGNEITGNDVQIRFSLGDSLTYVIDIIPATGSRRVRAG
jgi:prepilin-type N-terminal cleavage/methylation domain-containing protein